MEKLATHGGPKTKTTPFGKGRRFGEDELNELREALDQNTLFYAHGKKTRQFEEAFAARYQARHCVATSSGTASIHTALAAVGIGAGDEVMVSPITDMGSIIGILFQNAVPIFADVDPHTCNLDPDSVAERVTARTKAIEVVHLAGNPADMDAIMEIADRHGLYVIEDCAQSYLCEYKGRHAGTIGHIGCFSLNDFKHISAGDAGMLITDDADLAHRARLFTDKGYDRSGSGQRSPSFLCANYRMNELEAAVALAQLRKLDTIVSRRREIGERITAGIADLPGVLPHAITPGGKCSYWFYMLRVDAAQLGASMEEFGDALIAEGVPAGKGYIGEPVYAYPVLRRGKVYANFDWPEDFPQYGEPISYPDGLCPVAEEVLRTAITLPVNEFFTDADVEDIIAAVRKVALGLGGA